MYTEQIRTRVNLNDALNFYGLSVDSRGYCKCPFHNEKTGSLKVWSDHFYCFGCGASGDVITFVQRFFKLEFKEAMSKINEDFNLHLPIDYAPTRRESYEFAKALKEFKRLRAEKEERQRLEAEHYLNLIEICEAIQTTIKTYAPQLAVGNEVPECFWLALQYREMFEFELLNFERGEYH